MTLRRTIAIHDLSPVRPVQRVAIDFAPNGPTVGGAPSRPGAIAAFRALVKNLPEDSEIPADRVGRHYEDRILKCEPDPDATVSYDGQDGRQASRWIVTYGHEPAN